MHVGRRQRSDLVCKSAAEAAGKGRNGTEGRAGWDDHGSFFFFRCVRVCANPPRVSAGLRGGFAGRELPGEGQSRRRQPVHRAPPAPPGTYLVPVPGRLQPRLRARRSFPRAAAPASAGPTLHPPALNSLLPLSRGPPRFRRCRACGAAGGARGGCASIAALHKAIWFFKSPLPV